MGKKVNNKNPIPIQTGKKTTKKKIQIISKIMGKLSLKIYQTREKQFRLIFLEIFEINELLQNHLTHFPLLPSPRCLQRAKVLWSFGTMCPRSNTQNDNQMKHLQAKEFDFLGIRCSVPLVFLLSGTAAARNQFNISLP